jgi:hypothetical protein
MSASISPISDHFYADGATWVVGNGPGVRHSVACGRPDTLCNHDAPAFESLAVSKGIRARLVIYTGIRTSPQASMDISTALTERGRN